MSLPIAPPGTSSPAIAGPIDVRNYAEEGVEMFLIGQDMTADAAAEPVDDATTNSLAAAFTQAAGALALDKPVLDLKDVAGLLEQLAKRHFIAQHDDGDATVANPTEHLLPTAAPVVLADLATGMACSRTIRVVNFHATPRYRADEYRRQIAYYAQNFAPITPANFASAVSGHWDDPRPGLMPALFEGYRDNLDVLLPILEEFGFTGWFFLPSGFLNVPPHEQRHYAAGHQLELAAHDEYPGERVALTWDEARTIARRGHAFACHTRTHNAVHADTPQAVLDNEIRAAKAEMETELGIPVDIFCWLEGAAVGVNARADTMLRETGFRYLFSNFKIQKLQ